MEKEQYVSFETSQLLKCKGFDWETDKVYSLCGFPIVTQQMAMRWLRETHDIMIIPNRDKIVDVASEPFYDYFCTIFHNGNEYWVSSLDLPEGQHYTEYEDVVEAAILFCLKNIIK